MEQDRCPGCGGNLFETLRVPGQPDPAHEARRLYCVRCEDLGSLQAEDQRTDEARVKEGLPPIRGRLYSIQQVHQHPPDSPT